MKNLLLASSILLAGALPAAAQNGTWTERAPMTVDGSTYGRAWHTAGSAGGYFYVFGGFLVLNGEWNFIDNPLLRYDPSTNAWTVRTGPLRRNRNWDLAGFATGIGFGGTIYAMGDARYQHGSRRYNTASDTWTVLTPVFGEETGDAAGDAMGYGFFGNGAVATSDRIYVGMGWTNVFYEFNPAANDGLGSWTPSVPLPFPYRRPNLAAIDGKIYLAGGLYLPDSSSSSWYGTTRAYVFDPAKPSDGWVEIPSLPAQVDPAVGAAANGRMYVMAPGQPTYEYDPEARRWNTRATMPNSIYWSAGASMNINGRDRIYVAGDESGRTLEFQPPSPPAATNPFMRVQGGKEIPAGSWTNAASVEFGATLDLGGSGGTAIFQVEVAPASDPFTGTPSVISPSVGGGLAVTTPHPMTTGAWKVQYRAVHQNGMSGTWTRMGAGEADLYVDQVPPGTPSAASPQGRTRVLNRHGDPIPFLWTAVTDDRDEPVVYEVQVSIAGNFQDPLHTIETSGTTAEVLLPPNVDNLSYHWRVRSFDDVGNPSPWSNVLAFEVYWDDGLDHGAGDAARVCGFGVPGGSSAMAVLAALAVLAAAGWRVR